MTDTSNQIVAAQSEQRITRPSASFGHRGIIISNFDELTRFAVAVSKSGLAPKGFDSAESVFVAIQMGLEVGLSPMAALQNIAVVNGRPTIWGDAQLAVCRGTGEMESFEEWYEVGGAKSTRNPTEYKDDTAAVCRVVRAGCQPIESVFSVADAKRANLWGKAGPWAQYPFRMLRNRARSFALRDAFGDALKGFRTTEETQDFIEVETVPSAAESKLFKALDKPKTVAVEKENSPPAKSEVPVSNPVGVASLLGQVAELVRTTNTTWKDVCERLVSNEIWIKGPEKPEDASEEELNQAIHFWQSVASLKKMNGKGGAK